MREQTNRTVATARYATATTGVWPNPIASPCMKPRNVRPAPTSANADALANFRSMMNTAIDPSMTPPRIDPPPRTDSP